jgi:hypothetical protein
MLLIGWVWEGRRLPAMERCTKTDDEPELLQKGLCRILADTVEKVENRTAPKISRKLIFSRPTAAMLLGADTKVGDCFCGNDMAPHIAACETRQRP